MNEHSFHPSRFCDRRFCVFAIVLVWAIAFNLQSAFAQETSQHQPFDTVLMDTVHDGRVNYPAIASSPGFSAYIEYLANADPKAFNSKEEELAFWINAYNALAIQGILNGKSPSTFFGRIGYFKNAEFDVAGKSMNLYDLERDVIIPLGEPRIHFAIVCASYSCPMLRSEAYTAERLEEQLETNTRQFINDPERNRFDRERKVAELSKIFDWFTEDFEKPAGSVLNYVANYVDDSELASELRSGEYKLKFLKYNWSLNGTPPEGS